MQTAEDKTVISGLRWYASDRYGRLITFGGGWWATGKYVDLWMHGPADRTTDILRTTCADQIRQIPTMYLPVVTFLLCWLTLRNEILRKMLWATTAAVNDNDEGSI